MESRAAGAGDEHEGRGGTLVRGGVRWGMFERFGEYVVQYAAKPPGVIAEKKDRQGWGPMSGALR